MPIPIFKMCWWWSDGDGGGSDSRHGPDKFHFEWSVNSIVKSTETMKTSLPKALILLAELAKSIIQDNTTEMLANESKLCSERNENKIRDTDTDTYTHSLTHSPMH